MSVQDDIVEAIRKVYDPEIPVNIYDLGLVYTIKVVDRSARITITNEHGDTVTLEECIAEIYTTLGVPQP